MPSHRRPLRRKAYVPPGSASISGVRADRPGSIVRHEHEHDEDGNPVTDAPRQYWAGQMEEAYAFMERLLACPVAECGEPLAFLPAAAQAAGIEMDFPGGRKLDVLERVFAVRASLVPRLLEIGEALLRQDCVLRIEDAYRSLAVQAQGTVCDFILETVYERTLWELDGHEPTANLMVRRISVLTATTPKFANHTAGSAVDVSIVHRDTRRDLDRGGAYLEMSERTPMASPFLSAEARRNRAWTNDVFAAAGFVPYPYEFWHFSHGDADCALVGGGQVARFGPIDWDPATNTVTAVADPYRNLLPAGAVEEFLRRRRGH